MNWQDEAIVIAGRRFGESGLILSGFTRDHGRHKGLLRGGTSRRLSSVTQPGTRVDIRWRGRLAEQLGTMQIEPVRGVGIAILSDALRLAALSSICALVESTLPEREPHPRLYQETQNLLDDLAENATWPIKYVDWEVTLLAELGFGLELDRCAVSGRNEGLTHVSPRTGRAVTAEVAEPYADRLLVLPTFLTTDVPEVDWKDVAAGLKLTAYFLNQHVLPELGASLPLARTTLAESVIAQISAPGLKDGID
jgi:DNA repair protein RecO (recombination protein O)